MWTCVHVAAGLCLIEPGTHGFRETGQLWQSTLAVHPSSPVLGFQVHMATPSFHSGIGDLNSDPHAYAAGTLLTEPSP